MLKRVIAAALATIFAMPVIIAASPMKMHLANGEQANVPIIMYHALEDTPDNKWEITAAEFEADLKYLSENGYNAVFMQDLIDFVHEGRPLPQKPIVLSFDDGRNPTIGIVAELLEKYNSRISMAIIGKETDHYTEISAKKPSSKHPHMTWDDVNIAAQTYRVEISSHTYNLHGKNGARKNRGESDEAYSCRLLADLEKFAEVLHKNAGLTTNTLVYPLGAISKSSDEVIRKAGYLASLSCREDTNLITVGDLNCLYSLGRFLRPPGKSSEEFFKVITEENVAETRF